MPPKKNTSTSPKPGKPGKPPVGGAGIKKKTKSIGRTLRAAKKDAKGSFTQASKDQKFVKDKYGKLIAKDEARAQRVIEKELKTGKIEINGRIYDFGDKGESFKERAARGNYQVDKAVIENIRKTQGPVAAREYEAYLEARKDGMSEADAKKVAAKAAKEEEDIQKRIADKKSSSSVTEEAKSKKVVKGNKPSGPASRVTKPSPNELSPAKAAELEKALKEGKFKLQIPDELKQELENDAQKAKASLETKSANRVKLAKGVYAEYRDEINKLRKAEKSGSLSAKEVDDEFAKLNKRFGERAAARIKPESATEFKVEKPTAPAAGKDYTSEIKAIEDKMSKNSKDARKGLITDAEKKRLNKALGEQKNALQAEAKKAGAKVDNPADRPARQPKADTEPKAPKEPKTKVNKPKVTGKGNKGKGSKVNKPTVPAAEEVKPTRGQKAAATRAANKAKAAQAAAETKPLSRAEARIQVRKQQVQKGESSVLRKVKDGKAVSSAGKSAINFKATRLGKGVSEASKAFAPAAKVTGKVFGRIAGPLGVILSAQEAVRLGTTAQGQREYMDMRFAIDNLMAGKTADGKAIPKGTMYSLAYDEALKNAKKNKAVLDKYAKRTKKNAAAFVKSKGSEPMPLKLGMVSTLSKTVKPKVNKKPLLPTTPKTPTGPSNGKFGVMKNGVYIVDKGDTLWDLSRKYGTTVDAIYKANPLLAKRKKSGSTQIFRGTQIKIPTK